MGQGARPADALHREPGDAGAELAGSVDHSLTGSADQSPGRKQCARHLRLDGRAHRGMRRSRVAARRLIQGLARWISSMWLPAGSRAIAIWMPVLPNSNGSVCILPPAAFTDAATAFT